MQEITKYIPHRDSLLLIDKIVCDDKDDFSTAVKITNQSFLITPYGVPSYCGIEYMAQSIAAFNSFFFNNTQSPALGFIVSIRDFRCDIPYFLIDEELIIKVKPILIVEKSGSFICEIFSNHKLTCSGKITAYVPEQDELEQLKHERIS